MTAWIVVTVVSKSMTSWLIDTFMTAWSSTITNCAAARMTSGPHFFMRRCLHPRRVSAPGTEVHRPPPHLISVFLN